MKVDQVLLKESDLKNEKCFDSLASIKPNIAFVFGSPDFFSPDKRGWVQVLRKVLPDTKIVGCSTAGEISDKGVSDKTLLITAAHMTGAKLREAKTKVSSMAGSLAAGMALGEKLAAADLKYIYILGKGVDINGSAVISGIKQKAGDVAILGGLAGDDGKFDKTYTLLGEEVDHDSIVAIGLYGDAIEVTYASEGGWQSFGPFRKVTKSQENVLFELDGKPALEVYKKYLGDKARDLPGSGLLFPLELVEDDAKDKGVIRTILGIDEAAQSITLAGDIPEGIKVRLMHATNEGIAAGASTAAQTAISQIDEGLVLLVSCVGRKLVMASDIEYEIDAVKEYSGSAPIAGFYSYGEICPMKGFHGTMLHNQTMTISHFKEKK